MKTYVKLIGVVVMLLTLAGSCRKDFDLNPSQSVLKPFVIQGKWQVVEYIENRTDYTRLFSRISFRFNPNGMVTGLQNNVETAGKWKYLSDPGKAVYMIDFGETRDPYFRLTESWEVVRQNNAVLELKVMRGDQNTKYLIFKKF